MLLVLLFGLEQQGYAQSGGEYDITLEMMGYEDSIASGPKSSVSYYFSLPANWEILDGNYITLQLEYKVLLPEGVAYPLAVLDVQFNNHLLHTEELSAPVTRQLVIAFLPEHFRLPEDPRSNVIQVSFEEFSDCELDVISSVTVKDTSVLHLVYRERPLSVDLALFPGPIYRRWALEPSPVRFVLPDEFDEADVRAAAIIAARLGQLTSHQLPISATLASEQAAYAAPGEHLIVVGSPDDNPLVGQSALPVPLSERQLGLHSQMPMTISPGSVLSYTISVENTASEDQSLIVEDRFSPAATFLGCGASCEQVASRNIRWDVGPLAAGQQASTTVTLQVTPVILPSTLVRHTATLFDSQGRILNVDTLATQIGEEPDDRLVTSPQQKSTRFFVQESQAVAEDAGVLQEIVSPWSERHVTVIVTGLSDEALLKAAHGLNPRNRFPGIAGESAIVEDTRPLLLSVSAPVQDIIFASLGYEDAELGMLDLEEKQYAFDFPPGSTLGEDSYLALHFAHAAIVSTVGGEIKVTLNGVPIGSAYLDDSNISDAWLKIPLSRTAIRPGLNRILIQATVDYIDPCLINVDNPYWLEIYADSFLHFDYRPTQRTFDLDRFPYPFNTPGDMGDLVFALSDTPSLTEIEGLLRIASLLGSGSRSKEFMPTVTFGGDFDLTSPLGSHVVAIGLPTMNPAIRSANILLPQPFVPGSNDIYQSIDSPIYGIPPGTDLGFVQELASPWDSEGNHALVVATGTTEEGVHWAMSALSRSSYKLWGDLALVRGDQIYSTDTRPVAAEEVFSIPVSLTPTPGGTPVGVVLETPTPQPSSGLSGIRVTPTREYVPPATTGSSRPAWLVPLLIVSLLVVVGVIVLTVRKARL